MVMGILDILLACFLGILVGVLTGLIPGVHVNTVGAFAFSSASYILGLFSPEFLAVFLLSLSVTHALLEFIPSLLLGVPDEGTALSVLPGHRMVLEGRAMEAVRLATIGAAGGIILTLIMLPPLFIVLPPLYGLIKPYMWILLVLVSLYVLITLSRDYESMLWAVILFMFSGLMGLQVFSTPLSPGLGLMTLFTGFFGLSTILYSLGSKPSIPEQGKFEGVTVDGKILRAVAAGGLASTLLGFLPGFGPAQGGILAQSLAGAREDSPETFIVALSGLNTSDALFSLLTLYLIGNPRSGIAVYISQIIQGVDTAHLMLFISASLLAVSAASIIALRAGDYICRVMGVVDYGRISVHVMIFMVGSILFFTLKEGASIPFIAATLIASTAFGLLPHSVGVSKSHLMGVLIIPAIIIYTGI